METSDHVASMRFDGGDLALDFVNTLGGLRGAEPDPEDEILRTYDDTVAWSLRADVVSEAVADRLARRAERHPRGAASALYRALELRATVDAVFRPLALREDPGAPALRALAEADREALARASLVGDGRAFRWSWSDDPALDAPLGPIVHAAVDLLTDGPLERLSICDNCRWLFLDVSKNRSRRWCSMEECGTAVKKRRYVERRRARRRAG